MDLVQSSNKLGSSNGSIKKPQTWKEKRVMQSSNSGDDKITETMQVDSDKETTKLESKKNAHESAGTAQVNGKSRKDVPVQPFNNSISKKGDETTQTSQAGISEKSENSTIHKSDESVMKLKVNRKSKEGNPVQPSNNSVSRKGNKTTQTKQADSKENTENLESEKRRVDGMSSKGDHVQPSSYSVSENRDETTQIKQADTDEITTETLESQNSAEIVLKGKGGDNVQPSNNSISKKRDESTQTKQVEKTENLEGQKSDESLKGKENKTTEVITVDNVRFRPLIKAIQERNWILLQDLVKKTPEALTETVSEFGDTIFHIINVSAAPTSLIKELASKISTEELQNLRGEFGRSVIFHAAIYGNRKAAKAYVLRHPEFPNIRNEKGYLPIHEAAEYGHKGIIQYLLSKTKVRLDDDKGVKLIKDLLSSGHYGIALDLWKRYPKLALENNADRKSILRILAGKPLAFESASWSRLEFWRRLIYNWIPLQEEYVPHNESNNGDIENEDKCSDEFKESKHFGPVRRIIYASFGALRQMIWHLLMLLVPDIKNTHDIKLTHTQTLKIVRILCHGNEVTWNRKESFETFWSPFLEAAKLGICEIVNEILNAYFYAYTYRYKDNNHGLLHMAILHRQEKIFKIVKERNVYLSSWRAVNKGGKTDNILHLAGQLAASSQVSGAALQMQRELQWFKAVESYVHPSLQEQQNKNNKTPREVFTEEHKELVKQGEQWMKGTATSCSVVAALIITVVFTAAFTVPGGNNSDGIPIFLHDIAFIVFVISDALALFSSTASVLMFLAILSSRYSEDDFLVSLPRKLIIGLITLFFSIASMMVAFGATLYIFLSHSWNWTIIPISLLGCLPVTLFAMLQFPLLVEILFSTYRPSISITPNT